MEKLMLWLADIEQCDRLLVGGKGANLGDLARGLKVPQGFCLTAIAYRKQNLAYEWWTQIAEWLQGTDFSDLGQVDEVSEKIRRLIEETPLLPEIEEALHQSYQQLCAQTQFHVATKLEVAVRSSATAEDMKDASFAGQQDTYLNINGWEAVKQAVKRCWASLWTSRAIHYRHAKNYDHRIVRMAVIIQEMLPAEVAGVMFTANPVNNSRNHMLIEAVRGLGEALVSGETAGDRYILRKEGLLLLEKQVADASRGAMLPDFNIRELALAGAKIERFYGDYQDIEWAYYQGNFYFLQTRPITTLAIEEPSEISWEELNPVQQDLLVTIQERFPEPVYPIDGAVVKAYFESQFRAMEKLGYRLPDVDWTRVRLGIFPEFFVPPQITSGILTKLALLVRLPKTVMSDPAQEWELHHQSFSEIIYKLRNRDFTTYPFEVIYRYLNDTFKQFEVFVEARYRLYTLDRLPQKMLRWILRRLFGSDSQRIWENLVAGVPCITLEINEALEEMAFQLRKSPQVAQLMVEKPAGEILGLLPTVTGGEDFLKEYDSFIQKYGDRETTMGLGALSSPTWRESPQVVFGLLKGMLAEEEGAIVRRREALQLRQRQAEELLAERLTQGWWRWLPIGGFVHQMVRHTRSYSAFRENSHYDLTMALYTFRELFFKLGERLVRMNILHDASDILYLSYDDIQKAFFDVYLHQNPDTYGFKDLVEKNKLVQEQRQAAWRTRKLKLTDDQRNQITGVPVSAGAAAGTARVITSPDDFHRVQAGDILVTPYTNPAWTPLFATVSAVVVDTGGVASHAAIIAREYGIPAVMGAELASLTIKDGQQIIVNGNTGIILIGD